jgi:tetratricopeptide (TPR) repeat protein
MKIGDLEKALEDFNYVVQHNEGDERALFYRGMTQLNLGEYDKAIFDLDICLTKNPKRGPAWLGRGLAHAEMGEDALAREDIKRAVIASDVERETFINDFAISKTMFNRSIALFDGDRGPWSIVVNQEEVDRIEQWQ